MMTVRAFVGAVFASLALAGVAHARAVKIPYAWTEPTPPFKIIDNVYWVGTEGLASFLIVTPAGDFLIDGGLKQNAPQIERSIAALGFKLSDVRILLNTHAHFDHSGGLAQLKKDTGAPLYASEGDVSALESGSYLGSESDHAFDSVPVKVDRALKDGETISLGGVTLTANLTPGHTRGCTSYSFAVHDTGRTYNALIFCSASVAANRLVGAPQYPGIVDDYRLTFAKARAMHVDVFLAPHAEFFHLREKRAKLAVGGPNPFIDPSEFAPFIDAAEADFNKQLAAQEAALKTKGETP